MEALAKPNTKEAIIDAASQLFSLKGYNGASVREIASAAQANVAAVNYHFGDKKNLYWAVVYRCYSWADAGMESIAKSNPSLPEAIVKYFEYLMTNPEYIRTSIRIIMTDEVPPPDGELKELWDKILGPPGEHFFASIIKKHYGDKLDSDLIYFAVQSLFGNLMFTNIICTSSRYPHVKDVDPRQSMDEIKKRLAQHAQIISDYIKQNSTH